MRELQYFPLIHANVELGEMSVLADATSFDDSSSRIVHHAITEYLRSNPLKFKKVKIYADGLPNDHRAQKAVIGDYPMSILMRRLKAKGARIMGTEDPVLLDRLFRLSEGIPEAVALRGFDHGVELANIYAEQVAAADEPRDRYIAQRIDRTLYHGETGLFFMGMAHRVRRYLPSDIQFVIPRSVYEAIPQNVPEYTDFANTYRDCVV